MIHPQFTTKFLYPIRSFKKKYIPLLMVYFAFGAQALATVAITFWEKDVLSLSAKDIISVSFWITIPWTAKIVIGQLIDSRPLFGSYRKSWVYLGAGIMALGYFNLYSINKDYFHIAWLGSEYSQYVFSYVMVSIGYMIQDASADAMSTEVIDRSQAEEIIKKESATIQILGRLTLMISAAITAVIGGLLAKHMSYDLVFLCALVIPLISITGVSLVKLEDRTIGAFKPTIFFGGLLFIAFIIITSLTAGSYKKEIIFIGSLVVLIFMMKSLLTELPKQTRTTFILGFTALFAFQAIPSVGPGYTWWTIDTLQFDQLFIGTLAQVGGIAAIFILWLASDFIARSPIKKVLLLLIICNALFQIPNIALYHGAHEYLGINAKAIALLDSSLDTPLTHITFIPILAFIAYHAPRENKATWFAVSASLINMGITAKHLGSKYLNQLFTVSREVRDKNNILISPTDYSELGILLFTVFIIGIVIPLIFILPLRKT